MPTGEVKRNSARAVNEEPWQPLPGMVKRRCDECFFLFATPEAAQKGQCPDCLERGARERKEVGRALGL